MSNKRVWTHVYLLPNYFKPIGITVIIFAAVIFVLQTQTQLLTSDQDFKIPVTLLLIGLTLLNFSKEKVEDERIKFIRYRTWAYSFYIIIGYVVFGRILNYFLEDPLEFYNSPTAILIVNLTLNLVYFSTYKEIDYDEE